MKRILNYVIVVAAIIVTIGMSACGTATEEHFIETRLTLDPVNGSQTIAGSKGIFNWVSEGFKNYGANKKGVATKEMVVGVREVNTRTNPPVDSYQCYQPFEHDSLDKVCLTQHQILNFIQKYHGKLNNAGLGTFFLFKANNLFFIAGVSVVNDSLRIRMYRSGTLFIGEKERLHEVLPLINVSKLN